MRRQGERARHAGSHHRSLSYRIRNQTIGVLGCEKHRANARRQRERAQGGGEPFSPRCRTEHAGPHGQRESHGESGSDRSAGERGARQHGVGELEQLVGEANVEEPCEEQRHEQHIAQPRANRTDHRASMRASCSHAPHTSGRISFVFEKIHPQIGRRRTAQIIAFVSARENVEPLARGSHQGRSRALQGKAYQRRMQWVKF